MTVPVQGLFMSVSEKNGNDVVRVRSAVVWIAMRSCGVLSDVTHHAVLVR